MKGLYQGVNNFMRRICLRIIIFLCYTLLIYNATEVFSASITVNPSSAWCNSINNAAPGDEILFAAGSYTTPCWITAKGTGSSPIVIQSQSEEPSQQAVFAYKGSTSNVTEFRDGAA